MLRQSHELRWEVEVDDAVAALVAACDGTAPVGFAREVLAASLGLDDTDLARALAPVVRDLVGRGMLLPPRPPEPGGCTVRAVVQRVTRAEVRVDDAVVGAIAAGLLVLVGVTHDDTPAQALALARKVHGLRILRGELSLADVDDAGVLAVSQFTLYGDVRKGRRPTWAAAAPGPVAEPLFDAFVASLRELGTRVGTGVFGADMRVDLTNDGPMTLVVEV